MATVPQILHEAGKLYESRNREYANNYRNFGPLMKALFPDGISKEILHSNQFGVFMMLVGKFSRLAQTQLQHVGSVEDIVVYSAMLQELMTDDKDIL